jgi:hypothetical protein
MAIKILYDEESVGLDEVVENIDQAAAEIEAQLQDYGETPISVFEIETGRVYKCRWSVTLR